MRILYLQYANPAGYPPIEHSSRILAGKGWQVTILGIGALGKADSLEFPPHPNIQVRRLPFCPPGWGQKLHFLRFAFWAFLWLFRWRPQWIYASDMLACPAALALSYWPGVRVAYHEHDLPADPSNSPPASTAIRFAFWAREKLARRAAFCIVPNDQRGRHLADQTRTTTPVISVWNCPSLEEVLTEGNPGASQDPRVAISSFPRPTKRGEGNLVLFYHGTIVPVRLPLAVLSALAQLPENILLRFAGYETIGHPGYVDEIRAETARLGLSSRVEYLGAVPQRAELLAQCRNSDIGLAFMPGNARDPNEQSMAGASNKAFEYMACGLALLVSDLPDWKRMFVEPGYGLACDPEDPASLAKALRWFIAHPEAARQMGARGRKRIADEWNYESRFDPVVQRLCKPENLF